MTYYVQSDFGTQLRGCTPDINDNFVVQNNHADYNAKIAAEFWNQQTRSLPLVYGGNFTGTPEQFCASPAVAKPAVFIMFEAGCACEQPPGQCSDSTCVGANPSLAPRASLSPTEDCADAVFLRIYGDPDSYQSCTSNARNWRLDPVTYAQADYPDMPSVARSITHELGHALNLDHPSYGSIFDNGWSMMSSTTLSHPARHPFYWEKDCVDDSNVSSGRAVKYFHKSYLSGSWSGIQSHPYLTERGMWSGHFWKNPSGVLTYAVYHSNGWLNYGYGASFGGYPNWTPNLPASLKELDTLPVLFAPITSGTADKHRIIHTWANSASNYYPPYVRYHQADNFLFSDSQWQYLKYCTASNCSSLQYLRSNYPVSTTWDPYTWQDIFVRLDGLNQVLGGDIVIHPGLHAPDRLRQSVNGTLSTSGTTLEQVADPSPTTYWEYRGLTDSLPGVACAPNRNTFAFNCLLAWVDRGAPTGKVHYTYFRVNSSTNAVEWHGTSWKRSGSRTAGPVAVTYAHGRFWMAWKSWHAPARLTTTYTSSSYTGWSALDETTRPNMVGPPSFQSWPVGSSAAMTLVWTELN